MGYRRVETRSEIRGFWNRVGIIEGILTSRVEKGDNTFYIIRLLTDAAVTTKDETGSEVAITARPGDHIAISGTTGIKHAFDDLLESKTRMAVRLTSRGKKPNRKGGGEFWDIEVEAQPASEAGTSGS